MPTLPPLELLCCPECRASLTRADDGVRCSGTPAHAFREIGGVIRFEGGSTVNYNDHWAHNAVERRVVEKVECARRFVEWLLAGWTPSADRPSPVFLDVGCGDGNHLPFMPAGATKIALDYSGSVDLVARAYPQMERLHIIQGNANKLPLADASVDVFLSYGCLNCTADPRVGLEEARRVTRPGGLIGVWGFGTSSAFVAMALRALRWGYQALPAGMLRQAYVTALIPSLLFVKNSTGINPLKNSLAECREIVSTNLSPEHLLVFDGRGAWSDLVSPELELKGDFELYCGQKFTKRRA